MPPIPKSYASTNLFWQTTDSSCRLFCGDVLQVLQRLPSNYFHTAVTSPPYWRLRRYGDHPLEIGQERSPELYIERLALIFNELRRVLRSDGTFWLNIGDTFGPKPGMSRPGLANIPHRLAERMCMDGWFIAMEHIYSKPCPIPESTTQRCTRAHEYLFMFAKNVNYYFDMEEIKELAVTSDPSSRSYRRSGKSGMAGKMKDVPGQSPHGNLSQDIPIRDSRPLRHKRSVWTIDDDDQLGKLLTYLESEAPALLDAYYSTLPSSVWTVGHGKGYKGKHFAVYPPALIEPCILAGSSSHGCCSSCGSPYVRQVERHRYPTRPGHHTKVTGDSTTEGNRDPQRHVTITRTLGWSASCSCKVAATPCRVLDPFLGSGTTALVALQHHRFTEGIDLFPEYLRDHCIPRICGVLNSTGRSHLTGKQFIVNK